MSLSMLLRRKIVFFHKRANKRDINSESDQIVIIELQSDVGMNGRQVDGKLLCAQRILHTNCSEHFAYVSQSGMWMTAEIFENLPVFTPRSSCLSVATCCSKRRIGCCNRRPRRPRCGFWRLDIVVFRPFFARGLISWFALAVRIFSNRRRLTEVRLRALDQGKVWTVTAK